MSKKSSTFAGDLEKRQKTNIQKIKTMKKFFAVAMMAITMMLMASCGVGSSSSYEQGDPMPKIDASKATVNGRSYDNEKECCWKVTFTYKITDGSSTTKNTDTNYVWCTEFELVALEEMAMWTAAQTGKYASCSYSYIITTAKDYESCVK